MGWRHTASHQPGLGAGFPTLAALVDPVQGFGATAQCRLHGLQIGVVQWDKAGQHPDRGIPVQTQVFTARVQPASAMEDAAGVLSRPGQGNGVKQGMHQ